MADSREIKCNRFSHQQVIRILHHCMHQKVHDFEKRASMNKPLKTTQPDLSQVSTARKTDPSITRSKTSQPSQGWRPTRPRGVQAFTRSPFNVRPPKRVLQYWPYYTPEPIWTPLCFRLSLHVVGKPICLVVLWQNTMRREIRCPLYCVRDTFCSVSHETGTVGKLRLTRSRWWCFCSGTTTGR